MFDWEGEKFVLLTCVSYIMWWHSTNVFNHYFVGCKDLNQKVYTMKRFCVEKDLEGSQFMMKLEDNCLILILSKTILNTFLIVKVLSGKIYLDEGQELKLFLIFWSRNRISVTDMKNKDLIITENITNLKIFFLLMTHFIYFSISFSELKDLKFLSYFHISGGSNRRWLRHVLWNLATIRS